MEWPVFLAVLAAALMHAGWNAMVRAGLDRFSSILLLSVAQGGLSLGLLGFFPVPAPAAWPWLAASVLLHVGYKLFLARAYAHGELSQVYPIARGTAPLVVALLGASLLGEAMTGQKALAVAAIGLGVLLMSARGGALGRLPPATLLLALGTAGFTAAYTLVDGVGARLSGTASGFTMWMFVGDGIGVLLVALATRGRGALANLPPRALAGGLVAGALSLASYWIAIWAFTQAPIALVAALRETSVLFAMLIGILFLKERAGHWRWAAASLIVCGIGLMRV